MENHLKELKKLRKMVNDVRLDSTFVIHAILFSLDRRQINAYDAADLLEELIRKAEDRTIFADSLKS